MKFAAIALSLGCTAAICGLAVRSEIFSLQDFHPDSGAQKRSLFGHSWLAVFNGRPFSGWRAWKGAKSALAVAPPLLSRAEALELISTAATKYRVPAAFVTSIVAAESNFDATAVSNKGAIGLMQLMPETAQEFGADPAVPAENVDAGTHYLHWLMDRYQHRRGSMQRVIAAYNAGPGMVDHYRGVPPFRETRNYVARVLGFLKQFSRAPRVRPA